MEKVILKKFNKLIIYYFSGTGNARNVAYWIENIAINNNIEAQIIDISKLKSRKSLKIHETALIGFCSPTHGFNFPPIMFHFLLRFPKSKLVGTAVAENKVFIINTRAGLKAGKYFLPGLGGMAQYFSALILLLKGCKIVGIHPIDLPSNWISFHPGVKPNVVDSIYKKRKRETERFASKVINGGKDLRGLKTILIDVLISPIAFLYYIIGRFILAKSFYASKDCTNCNICIQKCPIHAIKTIDNRPFWTYKCESCMQCMNICPERAIEAAHGYLFAIYYLITSVLIVKIYKLLNISEYLNNIFPSWLNNVFSFIIDTSLLLFLFFVFYRIFHYLLRYRLFERIIVFTSLTKFKFWRRYKSPKY
ncbi:MAG: EFR1 family ferrodoxin [Bacteroidales bacterium]|jgi:ferredoxin|nr:EFR1 family ferrodoxin [Bacteroidales bacterium]